MFLFGGGSKKQKKSQKSRKSEDDSSLYQYHQGFGGEMSAGFYATQSMRHSMIDQPSQQSRSQSGQLKSTKSEAGMPQSSVLQSSSSATVEDKKENAQYQTFEVLKFQLPPQKHVKLPMEMGMLENRRARPQWGIDAMLIDEELLYLEDDEADRVYQELKEKSDRRRQMEARENRLSTQMMIDESIAPNIIDNHFGGGDIAETTFDSLKGSSSSVVSDNSFKQGKGKREAASSIAGKKGQSEVRPSQSYEKIRTFIKKSNTQERLEFTQGIINFAYKIDKKFLAEGLLPNLQILANEKSQDIKIALIDQFIPLINFMGDVCGQKGYEETVHSIFPMLDQMLYDPVEAIRDKAISTLTEIRKVVQQPENDYIMNLTLKLAHDDQEINRVSSLKIMNELAADMGQTLCESYIGPEIRSLSIDENIAVRQAVAKNLLNASKTVSLQYFTQHLFPMYERLTKDNDEKIRKGCAEVIAEICKISPLEQKAHHLQDIYFRFLKDPSSKIVRGTAYQNIGPFIVNFKDKCPLDQRIIDFYISTTEASSNKDVCYYSSFNFPAFIYVLGKEAWPKFSHIYHKLCKFNEMKIQRTLSASIHELARILGPEITETDLVHNLERFLSDKNPFKEARIGSLRNLPIFLKETSKETRQKFLKYILQSCESSQLDWRMKLLLATNIGGFALLYDQETTFSTFLQIFFRYCFDPVAKVAETASLSLPAILQSFQGSQDDRQESVMRIVRKYFFSSETYKRRQLFVIMCSEALNDKELFHKYFKRDMLSLASDKVISVRMALARVLKQHYLTQLDKSLVNNDREVNAAIKKLQNDKNSDVRLFVASIPILFEQEAIGTLSTEETLATDAASSKQSYDESSEITVEATCDLDLEIMVTDAMAAAQQHYEDSQSKLRSSIYGDELLR